MEWAADLYHRVIGFASSTRFLLELWAITTRVFMIDLYHYSARIYLVFAGIGEMVRCSWRMTADSIRSRGVKMPLKVSSHPQLRNLQHNDVRRSSKTALNSEHFKENYSCPLVIAFEFSRLFGFSGLSMDGIRPYSILWAITIWLQWYLEWWNMANEQ